MDESYGDEQPQLLHCEALHSNAQWGAADLPRFSHGQSLRSHQEAMVRFEPQDGGLQTPSGTLGNRSHSLLTKLSKLTDSQDGILCSNAAVHTAVYFLIQKCNRKKTKTLINLYISV